jgi:hypothetical protein
MDDLMDAAFRCVRELSMLYHIDESHAMKHSMDVLNYTMESYQFHVLRNPQLLIQQRVLYTVAVVHDMCDKKYVDESVGLQSIHTYLYSYFTPEEFNMLSRIITTMSYSTVRTHGYPELYDWQLGYHIVREADLLASYDMDRCVLYGIYCEQLPYTEAVLRAKTLYQNRVMRYLQDGVFVTNYGVAKAHELHGTSMLKLHVEF